MFWDVGVAWAVRKGKLKVLTNLVKADKIPKKQHTNLGEGVELFNLENDGSEQINLANKHPEIVEELTIIYKGWKTLVTK